MKLPVYQVLNQQQSTDSYSIQLRIALPADLDFFNGHFDQMAILPAVGQLFIVKKLADKFLPVVGSFIGLRQLKFKSPILPETELVLLIDYKKSRNQMQFEYHSLGLLKSKGIFLFEQGAQL